GPEHAHAGLALDVVLPLICIWMPVQLAHAARFHLNQRCSDGLRHWKNAGVGDPHCPTLGLDRLLRHHSVAEALRHGGSASDLVRAQRAWDLRAENVEFARVRDVTES